MGEQNKRVCKNGHTYYKSSDCPTCPECERENKPATGFLSLLAAPARRALETAGITSLHELAKYTEAEILKLHGMGPASLPVLREALKSKKLTFQKGK